MTLVLLLPFYSLGHRDRKPSNTRGNERVLCHFVFVPFEVRLTIVPTYCFLTAIRKRHNK